MPGSKVSASSHNRLQRAREAVHDASAERACSAERLAYDFGKSCIGDGGAQDAVNSASAGAA